jgi:uncharacterized protein with HEPN domain
MNRTITYLKQLREQIRDIEDFSSGGHDEFFKDRKTQNAIIRSYEVIGEIAKRISPDVLAQENDISWKQIIKFRDFLIHNYDKVDLTYVWNAVEQLPALKAAVEAMLAKNSDDDNSD